MADQKHPYNPDLSHHFANLTLSVEAQALWEANQPDHDQLDNIFAMPVDYYDQLLIASDTDGSVLYDVIQQDIRATYEQVGVIRYGERIVPDYEDADSVSLTEINNASALLNIMNQYSNRFAEMINNTVRYGRSNALMGIALRSKSDGHGVIVLRGTITVDEWLNNMNFNLNPFHPKHEHQGQVHAGFRDIYKGIRGRYRELAAELTDGDKPLYITGHSLGAALTQIAALDLSIQNPAIADRVQAYLYASPRVGDVDFVAEYDQKVATSYRIVNLCDIVPFLPFEEISAMIEGQNFPYAHTKGELAYVHQVGNPISNHLVSYHLATRDQIHLRSNHHQPVSLRDADD